MTTHVKIENQGPETIKVVFAGGNYIILKPKELSQAPYLWKQSLIQIEIIE